MTSLDLLKQCAWAATLILPASFAAGWVLRGAPAAWRHFLWTAALGGLLILPAMVRVMPKWGIETPLAIAAPSVIMIAASEPAQAVRRSSPGIPIILGWLAGCALVAIRFLAGWARAGRMVRRATDATYAREVMDAAGGMRVRVLESAETRTALAAGILKPVVVLPAGAGEWPVERLRTTLLHEWMHVRRRDLGAQAIAQATCCLYWFHPLVWLAARQLRREREQACDDAVLGCGIAARDYAEHLVESVRALRGNQSGAMAMAEPSLLEVRVRALLDRTRDRRPLGRIAAASMVVALAVVLVPVAAITVHAQAAPAPTPSDRPAQQSAAPAVSGILAGTVWDPSGARIPNCVLTATSADGSRVETTTTDSAGAYQFSLPAGQYTLRAAAAGFKQFTRNSLPVEASQTTNLHLNLALGSVSEALTVTAARPAAGAAAAAVTAPAGRVRVGGMVQAAVLLYKVAPVYPDELRSQGIAGTVHLAAIIGKQGLLTEVHALGGPAGLIPAALEAVSHWLYQPSLLNGEPVAVTTMIDITFELK
jgi:beta-lactamase regulating signal transducer with metallopeptidase domain